MLAADYTGVPATLSACSLLTSNAKHEGLLGSEDEQLYQLNNLYVVPPSKADSITTGTNNHLWTQLDCWDYSKKITIAFRSKAMLELAQLKPEESEIYKDQTPAASFVIQYWLPCVYVSKRKRKLQSTRLKTMNKVRRKLMLQSTDSQSLRLRLRHALSQRSRTIPSKPSTDWWLLGPPPQVNASQQQHCGI